MNDYSMIVSSESNGLEYECRSTNAFAGEPLKTTLQLSVECKEYYVTLVISNFFRGC